MPRRVPALAVLTAFVCFGGPAPAGGAVQAVTLRIDNDGNRALRCMMVIAHFMSQELTVIAPGESLVVALARDAGDGSLFLRSGDGRRKPVENILCGADDDWSGTRGELPLLPLRSSPTMKAIFSCRAEEHFTCGRSATDR